MHTLLLPGRSHVISDGAAELLLSALSNGRAVEVIPIELNGEGSGAWDVYVNVHQVIAVIRHPSEATGGDFCGDARRVVRHRNTDEHGPRALVAVADENIRSRV